MKSNKKTGRKRRYNMHFSVAVITKAKPSEDDIHDAIKEYDEGLEVKREITKEELIEISKKEMETYKNTHYKRFLEDPEKVKEESDNPGYINYLENEFPKKLKWTDDEHHKYMLTRYEENEKSKEGGIISYYNPKSKWDWFVIGGRYKDIIPMKDGTRQTTAKISDVDLGLNKVIYDESTRKWELIVEDAEPQTTKEKDYKEKNSLFKPVFLSEYGTKENFAEEKAIFCTVAIVNPTKDGWEWHESGDTEIMWRHDDVFEKNDYKMIFNSILEVFSDHWITIVDCHI